MPAGQAVSRFGSGIFFFVVATNLHVNLYIKLCPLLSLRTQTYFRLSRFSRRRESRQPEIRLRSQVTLSYKGWIALIVFNKSGPMKIYYWRIYHEGGDPLIPTWVTSNHHLIYSLNLDSILLSWWRPYCLQVLDSTTPFSKRKLTLLKRQMERIASKKHSTVKTVEIGEFLEKESCFVWQF